MWDTVCQLNVHRRIYKTASPRWEELPQFSGDSFQLIARLRHLGFLHESVPCPCSCRSGRQRFSGLCPAQSPLVSRNRWWSVARLDFRVLAIRCAMILVAPTSPQRSRRRRKRSGNNDPGTSACSRSSRLRPLSWAGYSRVPLCDDITAVAGGRGISARSSSCTTPCLLCSRCSTRASARTPTGAPEATFIQCMHVARGCRNISTGTHRIGARCCCGMTVGALERQRSLLRRSSLLSPLQLLLVWQFSRSCIRPS